MRKKPFLKNINPLNLIQKNKSRITLPSPLPSREGIATRRVFF
jgi:hypothetical protein